MRGGRRAKYSRRAPRADSAAQHHATVEPARYTVHSRPADNDHTAPVTTRFTARNHRKEKRAQPTPRRDDCARHYITKYKIPDPVPDPYSELYTIDLLLSAGRDRILGRSNSYMTQT